MDITIIKKLTHSFNAIVQQIPEEADIEFWYARDLMIQLGYTKWQNFGEVITKAKTACSIAGEPVENHFTDVSKMVSIGSGAERPVQDLMLTRYACYLIAQNGDSRKKAVAFAQTYFAVQTRKQELIEERLHLQDRLQARQKLTESETELSKNIYERGVFALVITSPKLIT